MKLKLLWVLVAVFTLGKALAQIPTSNLKCWLKSDAGLVSTGNQLNKWQDQSGNLFHFSTTSPPQVSSNAILNFQAIEFSSSYLLSDSAISFSDFTLFIVFKKKNPVVSYERLIDQNISTGFWIGRDGGTVNTFGGGYKNYGVFGGYADSVANIICINKNGTNWELYNSYNLTNQQTIADPSASVKNKIAMACDLASLSSRYEGYYFEFIMYDASLNTTDRNSVTNYLENKYAPPVNLGPDLSYCTSPLALHPTGNYYVRHLWNDGSTNDTLIVNGPGKYYVTTQNIFGRFSTDTILVKQDTVHRTVSLGNDTTICNGQSVVINAGPPFLNYTWTGGPNTNTISINTQGTYTVTLTDCIGNVSQDDITVTVRNLPAFNFGSRDTTICANTSYTLDPGFANSLQYTFNWQNNSPDSIFPITSPGQYFVDVTDNIGCSFSDTINIAIDASINAVSLGNDTTLCSGNQIKLVNGAGPGLSYLWSTGSTASSITVNTTGQYSVVVTNTNNCIARDTIVVTIAGLAPSADFAFAKTCKNNQTTFTDQSTTSNTIINYAWNFGDPASGSNTSTLNNPFHTFSDTGYYSVTLIIKTDVGCEGTVQKNIHIAPTPTLNFSNGISCQNDSTVFTSTAGSPPYPIQSYLWNFGDPASGIYNTSSAPNPKHLFSNQLAYAVKLIVTNSAGCKDSISKNILVKAQVKADFTYTPPCIGAPTLFQDASIVPAPAGSHNRLWSFSTPTNTLSGLNVNYTYPSGGIYTVSLTVTGTNGCISKTSKNVLVFSKPVISFTTPIICAKDTITIINSTTAGSGIISSYNWKLNNSFLSATQNPTLSIHTAGNHILSLAVKNSMQCKDSVSVPITVFPLPLLDFSTNPSLYLYTDSTVTFIPTPANGSVYNWVIDHTNSSSVMPVYVFDSAGIYPVTLMMEDANGCRNYKTKNIQISDSYLDLAITDINTHVNQNNYLETKVSLINLGSIPVHSFEIRKSVLNAGTVNEQWTGIINPGGFYEYTFTSKELLLNPADRRIVCATIEQTNFRTDDNSSNNHKCISFNHSSIEIFDPYPNPTETSVTIPVSVTKTQTIEFEVIDGLGQFVMSSTSTLNEGLNYITLNTDNLTGGCYLIKMAIDGATHIKKIIKR